MFKKLIKVLLATSLLLTGIVLNPSNIKAAQIDNTIEPLAHKR